MNTRLTESDPGARSEDPSAPARALSDLSGPRPWPLLGNLPQMRPLRVHQILEQWALEHGAPYRLILGKRTMLVTSNMEAIGRVLRERPNGFRRGRPVESVFAEMGITGVFSAEGEQWSKQRRLVMKAFDPAHLRDYYPSLQLATERLRQRWHKAAAQGKDVDLVADLMRYTVDVTAGLAFGVDINTIGNDQPHGSAAVLQTHLDKVFPTINRRLTSPWPYWRHVKLPADRRLDAHLAQIRKTIDEFIALARQRLAAEPGRRAHPHNLIEALLVARDTEGSGFDDRDVSGNIFTALLAGEDTTANTLAWLSDFLCDAPQWQQHLAEEATALDPACNFEAWQDLPLHEAAIQEAMRLKPVAPVLFFENLQDTVLDGVHLPRNTPIATLMRPPASDPARFVAPECFDPARWMGQGDHGAEGASVFRANAARKSLMPFGAGPRFCPGRYLAMLEIKMVCAMMMREFTLERRAGSKAGERYNLSMMPEGLWVRFVSRR